MQLYLSKGSLALSAAHLLFVYRLSCRKEFATKTRLPASAPSAESFAAVDAVAAITRPVMIVMHQLPIVMEDERTIALTGS